MDKLALALALGAVLLAGCEKAQPHGQVNPRELYQQLCARCHGINGSGGIANNTGPTPRDFRDAAWQASRSDEDLKKQIKVGRGSFMPAFAAMSDAQLGALVGVVRGFGAPAGPPAPTPAPDAPR